MSMMIHRAVLRAREAERKLAESQAKEEVTAPKTKNKGDENSPKRGRKSKGK